VQGRCRVINIGCVFIFQDEVCRMQQTGCKEATNVFIFLFVTKIYRV
jgi:hypothetical protein